ncbi:MAG: FAD-dependent oxidoreductase, partial [Gammaproteobacteria bacterium]|nr:FAD-dependent oxidoreductase [Gammaproteobacteria bacterium]
MRIAVVGGGFTGCMAALHASARGARVSLFEAADHLGGVLREVKFGERAFFNNCQYLSADLVEDEPWMSGLEMFPHEYGSLTALGNAA